MTITRSRRLVVAITLGTVLAGLTIASAPNADGTFEPFNNDVAC